MDLVKKISYSYSHEFLIRNAHRIFEYFASRRPDGLQILSLQQLGTEHVRKVSFYMSFVGHRMESSAALQSRVDIVMTIEPGLIRLEIPVLSKNIRSSVVQFLSVLSSLSYVILEKEWQREGEEIKARKARELHQVQERHFHLASAA